MLFTFVFGGSMLVGIGSVFWLCGGGCEVNEFLEKAERKVWYRCARLWWWGCCWGVGVLVVFVCGRALAGV